MAIRTSPAITFHFPADVAGVASNTRKDQGAITLYSPENTSRTFRSVIIEFSFTSTETVAASITTVLMGIKLGAVAFNDVTITDTLTNTGEQQAFVFTRDVTSYFNSNFGSGTSQTCQVGTTVNGIPIQNICIDIIMQYEFSDTGQTTMIKTALIPLESHTATLTNTLVEYGNANQIPVLDTFFGENSIVYRDRFVVMEGATASNATTDFQIGMQLDAAAEVLTGNIEGGLNSNNYVRFWIDESGMATNATHTLKQRATVTQRVAHPLVYLSVTYEYNEDNTTAPSHSIIVALEGTDGIIGGTAAGSSSRFQAKFYIEEPGTITLKQSGLVISYVCSANVAGLNILAGGQATRVYTGSSGSVTVSSYRMGHRIDSGAVNGAGITLARGENTITVDVYRTSTTVGTMPTISEMFLVLNYTSSSKHADGLGVHNHTTLWAGHADWQSANTYFSSVWSNLPDIPETNYYVNAVSLWGWVINNVAAQMVCFDLEELTGEGFGDGSRTVLRMMIETDAEIGPYLFHKAITEYLDRYPTDPDTRRMALETSRSIIVSSGGTIRVWAGMYVTYHSITFTVSGTVRGYSGDGSGITVTLHREDTGEKVDSTTTAAGGTFSITVYDDTKTLFCQAQQDATHVGRSANGTAGAGFDIELRRQLLVIRSQNTLARM